MRAALSLGLSLMLASCGEPDNWQGWVYPDRSNLLVDIPIGKFDTLEECRDAALAKLEEAKLYDEGEPIEGDYECGLNCEPSGYGGNICEETMR